MFSDIINDGWSALLETPAILWAPAKRVYLPFLGTSLVIAAVVYWRLPREERPSLSRYLGSPSLWLHPSSRTDLKLIFIKALIRAVVLAPVIVSAVVVAKVTIGALTDFFGPATSSDISRSLVVLIYTVVLFVAWDFSRFALHKLMHSVPLLWEFHKVHHSAEVMTPLTNYRTHPVESLLYATRGALVTGFVYGGFYYEFGGGKAVQYDLLGVNAIGLFFNLAGANLRHSHVWLSYGRYLELFLISPAQHQIHHSMASAHHNKNFGSFLAIWDLALGSLMLATTRVTEVGLVRAELNHNPRSAVSCVLGPFKSLLRAAFFRIHRTLGRKRRFGVS